MELRDVFLLIVSVSITLTTVNSANILCIMTVPSPSHHIWNRVWMEALVERGHNLTTITMDGDKSKNNLTYIHMEHVYPALFEDQGVDYVEMSKESAFRTVFSFLDFYTSVCDAVLKSNGMNEILAYPEDFKFDLVIYDYGCGPCLLPLLHRFNYPPLLSLTPFNNPPYSVDVVGGHKHFAYTPYFALNYDTKMNLGQRAYNTLLCLLSSANRAIAHELGAKGHNVTIISADVEKDTPQNIHYVELEQTYPELYSGPHNIDLLEMANENVLTSIVSFYNDFVITECKGILKSKGLEFVKNYPDDFKFDLVIHDMTCGGCMHGLLHKFGYPPLVSVTAFNNPPYVTDVIGGHKHVAYIPFYSLRYGTDMTFMQRVHNTLLYITDYIYRTFFCYPKLDHMVRDYFQYKDMPYVPNMDRLSKIILVNAHYSIDFPEPAPPNLIPVGGLQIQKPKPLPKDIEDFINAGKKGAVLFSLGTNIRSDELGKERQQMFIDAIRQLPDYNFLWKFESDLDLKLPKNLIIRKWLPQSDMLAHPKIKGFITHAGLLSMHEATWHGVPMIGIPFIADQHRNLEKCIRMGVAERIVFQTLSTKQIYDTVHKVLESPSYQQNMKKVSSLFRDQPEKPLDRAIWWIEWVLRHPDFEGLQSPVLKLGFLKSNLVDVIGFFLLAPLVVFIVLKKCLCKGRHIDREKKTK